MRLAKGLKKKESFVPLNRNELKNHFYKRAKNLWYSKAIKDIIKKGGDTMLFSLIAAGASLGATLGSAFATLAGTSVATGSAMGTIMGAGAGATLGLSGKLSELIED